MEVMLEVESDKSEEFENDDVGEDDTITSKNISTRQDQTQENVEVVQEERVEKLNMKQQIDLKSLMTEETKQYIYMDEKKKISKLSLDRQIVEEQQSIQQLQQKIQNQKEIQQFEELETNNEKSKLLEIKQFTQSTWEIVDVLKNYVQNMEKQLSKLKFHDLEKKVSKKYEESVRMMDEKLPIIKKIKKELEDLKSSNKATTDNFDDEIRAKMEERDRLKNAITAKSQENQLFNEELLEINKELDEKTEEMNKSSELDAILDFQESIKDFKANSTELQELETEHNALLTRIECSVEALQYRTELENELAKENSALEAELKELQDLNYEISEEYSYLEEMDIFDLKKEEENCRNDIEKGLDAIKNDIDAVIKTKYESEIMLLKELHEKSRLLETLSKYKNSNETETEEIEELKKKTDELEEEIQEKIKKMDEVEKETESLKFAEEQQEISMQNLQRELTFKKEKLDYEKNVLQVHLEKKLEELKNKLKENEEKKEKEKRKFEEVETLNKKKKKEHIRLRNIYLMLKTSSLKSPQKLKKEETKEVVESETSPKGILKSPNVKKADPTTPTKNVKFVGISSLPSSNDS